MRIKALHAKHKAFSSYLDEIKAQGFLSNDKLAATSTTHFPLRIPHRVHVPNVLLCQFLQLRDLEAAHLTDAADARYSRCQDGNARRGAYSCLGR